MDSALTTASGLAGLGGFYIVLTTIALPLRFYARRKQGARLLADDWLTIPSYVFFLALTTCTFWAIRHHFMGYPTPKNPKVVQKTLEELEKLYLVIDTFAVLTLGFSKLSALFFFRRIFCVSGRPEIFHYATTIGIVIVSLWMVCFFILNYFLCGLHIWAMWTPSIKLQDCGMDYPIVLALAISDVLLDFLILVLPIPKIWSLHTTVRRKFAIIGVFLLALVGLGASVARMAVIVVLEAQGQVKNFSVDPYLVTTEGIFFYVFEAGMSLLAVNLPSLWYFRGEMKPEALICSMRRLASFGSQIFVTSAKGDTTQPRGASTEDARSFSDSSQKDLVYGHGLVTEAFALPRIPLNPNSLKSSVPLGKVKVTESLQQSAEYV